MGAPCSRNCANSPARLSLGGLTVPIAMDTLMVDGVSLPLASTQHSAGQSRMLKFAAQRIVYSVEYSADYSKKYSAQSRKKINGN